MTRRVPEIDALKAAGVVTIVLIHSMRSPWDAGVSSLELWLGHLTRFGVPAFLFASGFLYATRDPVPLSAVFRRLRRILVPYLLASALALLWKSHQGLPFQTGSPWLDVLLGASFGLYYYVFVITLLVLLTPLFARLPESLLIGFTGAMLAAQWGVDAATLMPTSLFKLMRNPLMWWAYFLLGWLFRLRGDVLRAQLVQRRAGAVGILIAAILVLSILSGLEGAAPRLLVRSAAWLDIYAILGLILALSVGRENPPRWLRAASDSTFAIYLFHYFFVLALRPLFPAAAGSFALLPVLLPWIAGLLGPMAIVRAARALLGDRARDVIGA